MRDDLRSKGMYVFESFDKRWGDELLEVFRVFFVEARVEFKRFFVVFSQHSS